MTDIHIAKKQTELDAALKIREDVFIKGQNVPFDRERDGLDNSSEHALLYYNNKPAGTARIRYHETTMKLERIAILREARGKGLGIKLIEFLVHYGRQKHVTEINMHAQYYLVNYYSKFGFKQRGDIFYDAGIKHIEMFMKINTEKWDSGERCDSSFEGHAH